VSLDCLKADLKNYLPASSTLPAISVNFSLMVEPRVVAPPMMTTAIRAAIRPYSKAWTCVAPETLLLLAGRLDLGANYTGNSFCALKLHGKQKISALYA
jgi:hypothetical protein